MESPLLDIFRIRSRDCTGDYVRVKRIQKSVRRLFTWDTTDPLADVMLAQFGSYLVLRRSGSIALALCQTALRENN